MKLFIMYVLMVSCGALFTNALTSFLETHRWMYLLGTYVWFMLGLCLTIMIALLLPKELFKEKK